MDLENLITEANNIEEMRNHLQEGKLCVHKLADATILISKDNDDMNIYAVLSSGKAEVSTGSFDDLMESLKSIINDMGLPSLLDMENKDIDNVLALLSIYENGIRNN